MCFCDDLIARVVQPNRDKQKYRQEIYVMRTEDMPQEMQVLLHEHPRSTWETHPGFKERTRNWMGAHKMFRKLTQIVVEDCEVFLNGDMGANDYRFRLSHFGNRLIGNLSGHHAWEDLEYFPELSRADPRFDRGLQILEKDHEDLEGVLETFSKTGSHALNLDDLSDGRFRTSVGKIHTLSQTIDSILSRHLNDEEDLAVPIILQYRLRG